MQTNNAETAGRVAVLESAISPLLELELENVLNAEQNRQIGALAKFAVDERLKELAKLFEEQR